MMQHPNRRTMHCPSCGTEVLTSLKFRRSCGMSLDLVSKAVAEHLSADGSDLSKVEGDKRALQRMVKTMGLGGIILFAGIVVVLIGRKLLHNDLADLIGGLVLLAGVFIMSYAVLSAMLSGTGKTRKTVGSVDPAMPESGRDTSPEGLAAPAPSVTEQTTKTLETTLTPNSGKEPRA